MTENLILKLEIYFLSLECLFLINLISVQVGAPPEMASVLEEIGRDQSNLCSGYTKIGDDPELDEFTM